MPTFPLAMPQRGVAECEFLLQTVDTINTLVSGAAHADAIAPAFWDVRLTTAELARRSDRFADWSRFIDALRGAQKTCLLFDADLPYPRNYTTFSGMTRVGGGAFDGTANVTRTNAHTFTASALPYPLQLSYGDYVGFVKSGRYFLTRLVDNAVSGIAGEATLVVEPAVPAYFTSGVSINLVRPYGEFILIPQSVSRPRTVDGFGTISAQFRSRAW